MISIIFITAADGRHDNGVHDMFVSSRVAAARTSCLICRGWMCWELFQIICGGCSRRCFTTELAVVLVAAWWQMGAGSWWRQRRQGHLHTSILVITVIQFAHSDIPMNIDYQICMQYLEKVLTGTFSVLKVPVLSLACSVNLQVTQFYRWRQHV